MSFAIYPTADQPLCQKKQWSFTSYHGRTERNNVFIFHHVLRNMTRKNGLWKKFNFMHRWLSGQSSLFTTSRSSSRLKLYLELAPDSPIWSCQSGAVWLVMGLSHVSCISSRLHWFSRMKTKTTLTCERACFGNERHLPNKPTLPKQ